MKGLSRNLVLVGVVLLSFVLLSACATSSKDSAADLAADGAVAGVYKNEALGFTFTYHEIIVRKRCPETGQGVDFRHRSGPVDALR